MLCAGEMTAISTNLKPAKNGSRGMCFESAQRCVHPEISFTPACNLQASVEEPMQHMQNSEAVRCAVGTRVHTVPTESGPAANVDQHPQHRHPPRPHTRTHGHETPAPVNGTRPHSVRPQASEVYPGAGSLVRRRTHSYCQPCKAKKNRCDIEAPG